MVLIYTTPGMYSSNKKFLECPKFQMQFGMLRIHNIMQDTGQSPLTKSVFLECNPQETAPTNQEAGHCQPWNLNVLLYVHLSPERSATLATVQIGKMLP